MNDNIFKEKLELKMDEYAEVFLQQTCRYYKEGNVPIMCVSIAKEKYFDFMSGKDFSSSVNYLSIDILNKLNKDKRALFLVELVELLFERLSLQIDDIMHSIENKQWVNCIFNHTLR